MRAWLTSLGTPTNFWSWTSRSTSRRTPAALGMIAEGSFRMISLTWMMVFEPLVKVVYDDPDARLGLAIDDDLGLADDDLVAAVEVDLAADPAIVDESTVLARLVEEDVLAPLGEDGYVAARGELVREGDVAARGAAEGEPLLA
jgi:hypothetical protein